MSNVVSMQQLLEAGVHFGHITRRWDPKMAEYIYTKRNGIHIIDLQKTQKKVEAAYKAMAEIAKTGKKVIFVGTKKQAQDPVKEEALRAGQFYVDNRWLGGTLTNFKTIRKRITRLHNLYKMEENGIFDRLPKKEVVGLKKERAKLEKFLGGIKDMKGMPGAIFVVDPKKEKNAILEARKLNIPVFGIVDTNCDPDDVDYIIPGNDDAIRAVKLISFILANSIIEANGGEVENPTSEVPSERPKRDYNNKRDNRNGNYKGPRRDYNNNNRDNRGPRKPRFDNRSNNSSRPGQSSAPRNAENRAPRTVENKVTKPVVKEVKTTTTAE